MGADRVETMQDSSASSANEVFTFNPSLPLASGSNRQDFTAFYTGLSYTTNIWNVSARTEFHSGDEADKWNFLLGAHRQLAQGKVVSSSIAYLTEERENGDISDIADWRVG